MNLGQIFETASGGFLTGGVDEATNPRTVGVWASDTGSSWHLTTSDLGLSSGQCEGPSQPGIQTIYETPSGLVGFGSGVWRSQDGISWQCVGPSNDFEIAYNSGVFVGAGSAEPGSDAGRMWSSTDGVSWTQTQRVPGYVTPVPVADGFVALTEEPRGFDPIFLWTSPDGETWHQEPNPFGKATLWPLESNGSRAAVIEEDSESGDWQSPGAVWVSSGDGSHWARYQLPPRDTDFASSPAVAGNLLVVSGYRNNGDVDPLTPVIWVTRIQ